MSEQDFYEVEPIEEKKEEQTVTENNSQKTAEVRKGGKK